MVRLFFVFCLIPFLLGVNTYQPLVDKKFNSHQTSFIVEKHRVEMGIHIGSGDFLYEKIALESLNISTILIKHAEESGLELTECRPAERIDLYTTDMQTLNDKSRFTKLSSLEMGSEIWALFDQRPESHTQTAIVLTDHGNFNKVLLAHELAHYWHYRFCWDLFSETSSEDFAQSFEKIYVRKNDSGI